MAELTTTEIMDVACEILTDFAWDEDKVEAFARRILALAATGAEDAELISAYRIPTADRLAPIEIVRTQQISGPDRWAIRCLGRCLNKHGEWEWEPMPSSRDDAFLERCRFDTAQEAFAAARTQSNGAAGGGEVSHGE